MCMLTCSLLLNLFLNRGLGRLNCRSLYNNAITELAPTLFDKLTNLQKLYVNLQSAIHASGGEGCWALNSWRLSLH